MSTAAQLRALIIKDLVVTKRSKKKLLCELAFPLFFLPILIALVLLSQAETPKTVSIPTLPSLEPLPAVLVGGLNQDQLRLFNDSAQSIGIHLVADTDDEYPYRAINFTRFDVDSRRFQYRVGGDSSDLGDWIENEPFLVSETSLKNTGYLTDAGLQQYTVDVILLKLIGTDYREARKVNINLFPQQEYVSDLVTGFIPLMFVLVVFSTLVPMALIVKDVMHEKETEIKTYLLVMGMSRRSYYASHFIFGFVKMVLIMIILSMPVVYLLKSTVGAAYMGLVVIYSAFSVAFALFCATIFKRSSVAVAINVIGILGLLCLAIFLSNRLNLVAACLSALSPVSALSFGVRDLELLQRYDSLYALERISYEFNIIHSLIFLILDTIILIIFTLMLDANLDNVTFGNFWQMMRRKGGEGEETGSSKKSIKLNTKDFEPIEGRTNKPDVKVVGLQKKWGISNNFAVKNATFQAFRGEITALLGHNGAGKSTTFSCLTGFTTPTAGSITVCDSEIPGELAEARKHIGYCPQTNPLFDRLTCMEHLKLSARLRGVYNGSEECREILSKVGLEEAEDVLAVNLSGGMKRKLCVAMALVGESRVVLLDEPTAGMDPTARRQIGDILEKFKQDRTIILTTHYMDEADSLSDRILIMVKGKVICSGSPEFLKARFGTGFILTITLKQNVDIKQSAQRALELVKKFAPQAKFDGNLMSQFRINIPQGSSTNFAKMFEEIEQEQNELAIDAFGLSLNTLEQVFISVGEMAEKKSSDEVAAKITANAEKIVEEDEDRNPSFCRQLTALIWRNLLYFCRSPIRLLSPFVLLFLGFGLVWGWRSRDPKHLHSFGPLPYSQILTDSEDELKELVGKSLPKSILTEMPYDWEIFKQKQFEIPPISIGYFNHFKPNETHLLYSATLVNGQNRLLNIWSNLAFGNGELTNIETIIDAGTTSLFGSLVEMIPFMITIYVLGTTMSLLLNTVITERVTKFKHQLRLASVRWHTYWLAQFIPELAYFFVLAVAVFACFVVTEKQDFACSASIFPLYMLYFTASSMANYVFSFAFDSPTKASATMNAFHIFVPLVIGIADVIVVNIIFPITKISTPPVEYQAVMHVLSAVFPSVALLNMQSEYSRVCDAAKYNSAAEDTSHNLDRTLKPVYYMTAGAIFYLVLLIIIELKVFRAIAKKIHVMRFGKFVSPISHEESDVARERERVCNKDREELALLVQSLFKFYSKTKCAVKDLTFGMAPNECFGLLGVNGAGKTTTFDMLTNQTYPTSGEAYILGIDVSRTPAIGYCPQFDTLSGILTGRQTLQLLGKLNGFSNVNERVDLILECVLLEDKQNELVDTYSGGQKRRLSIAACLMSGSKFLILDEPTAGVDPATRRHIWDLLIAMRNQNKAILLTTHSMEECEALCTRIGFLRAGKLRGVGTSQHLKSRYGNSYILTLVVKNPGKENTRLIDEEVREKFDVPATDSSPEQAAFSWTIPKKEGAKWSRMYAEVEKFVEKVNKKHETEVVTDFYLIQDSLEQVFTRLANQGDNSVENDASIKEGPSSKSASSSASSAPRKTSKNSSAVA